MLRHPTALLGVGLGAAASLLVSLGTGASGLASFVSREGRFAAEFPGEPVAARGARDTWAGRMEEGSFELEEAGVRLRVEFHDVPRLATLLLAPGVILDLAKRGVLDDRRARDVAVEPLSLRGHPGLALRYEAEERPGPIEEARLFLVGSRLYVTFARAESPGEAPDAVSRFLSSFDAWEQGDAVAWAGGSPAARR